MRLGYIICQVAGIMGWVNLIKFKQIPLANKELMTDLVWAANGAGLHAATWDCWCFKWKAVKILTGVNLGVWGCDTLHCILDDPLGTWQTAGLLFYCSHAQWQFSNKSPTKSYHLVDLFLRFEVERNVFPMTIVQKWWTNYYVTVIFPCTHHSICSTNLSSWLLDIWVILICKCYTR